MANNRDGRIQPLVWYTLWEYKLYFVQTNKWYAKVFPRKWKPTKIPTFTFDWETKAQVIQKLDAHCLKTFGKVFRFKKMLQDKKEPKAEPKKEQKTEPKKECICWWYPEDIKKSAKEVSDGLLKFFVDIVVDMDTNRKLAIACLVTSGLSLLWVILLLTISL